MYDWRELRRWNISEARLPVGSVVQFRQGTMWEQYRFEIIGALAVVFFQAALIVKLLFERVARKRAGAAAGRAKLESDLYRENLAHLARVHTVGEMSAAIAHEVNQPLMAIKNYAVAARGRLIRTRTHSLAKVLELLDKIEEQAVPAELPRALLNFAKRALP